MIRLTGMVAALTLLGIYASAQTAGTDTHIVGQGDSLYGIVAQHYPGRMSRWTDVAADLVALNPDTLPQGLDTIMRLGDELILVDYSASEQAGPAPAATRQGAQSPDKTSDPKPGVDGSFSAPSASPDSVSNDDVAAGTVDRSGQRGSAPTDVINATAPTAGAPGTTIGQDDATRQSGHSGQAIGYVTAINSRVLATDHQNQQRILSKNDRIYFGDAVSTGDKAMASIRMLDSAEFHLQPASRLMFERYQYDEDTQSGSAVMTLVKGGFRTTSGLLGQHQPDAIAVNTAVAAVGIRGARFALRVCATNTCGETPNGTELKPGLYSGVLEGSIVLSNNTGDLEIGRGEFFYVAAPNTVPEAAPEAAQLLFNKQDLAQLDVELEADQPLSFFGWIVKQLFGD